jgi:GT2 family glycosyltransferase/glycosyltransferase involved in cell wall biosynthesis
VRVVSINNTFQACTSFDESYANPALLEVALREIDRIAPDVAHVHHLTCLSTGVLRAIAHRRVPIVMTLNDYWLACHRGQLLDREGRRCDGPFNGGCASCIAPGLLAGTVVYRAGRVARGMSLPGGAVAVHAGRKLAERLTSVSACRRASVARLEHMREAAGCVDLFVAPSQTLAQVFARFGIPSSKLRRLDQGICLSTASRPRRTPSTVLRLGFAGGLIPSKAPHLLLEAAAALPPGSVSVDLLGSAAAFHGDESYASRLRPLVARPFVRRVGPVPHERMPDALQEIDVLIVPSIWVENAPFVIREAFASGAPVVAANLGGMAEMVRDGVDGLLFEAGDASSLAGTLKRLLDEPGLLGRLASGIRAPMSIDADARQLRELYREVGARECQRITDTSVAPAVRTRSTCAIILNYRTPEQTWLTARSLQASCTPPGRLLIVDNGSEDGSPAWLRSRLPGADVIEPGSNLGFPGGCNVGIRGALDMGADAVLLVNSDVVLAPDALRQLLLAADECSDAGIFGPVLLSREEPDRVASAGIAYSRTTGRMRHRGAGRPLSGLGPARAVEVDALSGCVMLIRRAVFDRIGLMDEEYFFSFEDIDFCLKAREAGFESRCVSGALAYHEGGASIGRRSSRRVYFATRNHLRLAAVRTPAGIAARTARAAVIVGLNAAYALLSRDVPTVRGLGAVARGVWHHVGGRYGPD